MLVFNDPNSNYQPYFLYFKFGQQQSVTSVPITLRSTNLDLVIADSSRIFEASVHLAINFEHRDPRYSVFCSTQPTAGYLQGPSTKKFPLLGLSEVGNITCTFPCADNFMQAINRRDHGAIRFTYAQAYTPLTKALENLSPFYQRPFLLTLLLGKAFVPRTMDLSHVQHCTVEQILPISPSFFGRLPDINPHQVCQCPLCGPEPATVIRNGTMIGFRKDFLLTLHQPEELSQ